MVGSVAGQRYWSSMLNHKAVITCGIWTPDDQQVYFGTTAGQLIVMDVHGAMVSEIQLGANYYLFIYSLPAVRFTRLRRPARGLRPLDSRIKEMWFVRMYTFAIFLYLKDQSVNCI